MNKDEKKEAKLREKRAREQEKLELQRQKEIIREEKERIRNSLWYKLKTFISTVIFVAILLVVVFFALKYYLGEKQKELYNEEMNYYYSEGENFLSNKEYEKAIEMFNKVEEDAAIYKDAQTKLDETMKSYLEDYINASNIYVADKNYEKAIEIFENLPEELQASEEVKEAIASIEFTMIEENVKDIKNYVEKLIEIKNNMSDDLSEKAIEKVNEYIDETANLYMVEIKEKISSKNYETYMKAVESLLEVYGENEKINEIKELVKSYEPVSLLGLAYEKEEGTLVISPKDDKKYAEDTKKVKYDAYILVNETEKAEENSVTWKLNGEYTELSGKICLNSKLKNITSKGVKITILGDERVIYKSKKIKDGTNPFTFNVSIIGVDELKIVLESDTGISYFIGNPLISK